MQQTQQKDNAITTIPQRQGGAKKRMWYKVFAITLVVGSFGFVGFAVQYNASSVSDGGAQVRGIEDRAQLAQATPAEDEDTTVGIQACNNNNWNFGLSNHTQSPTPGEDLIYGAWITSKNSNGKNIEVKHRFDPNEIPKEIGIVHGDHHQVAFTAKKNQKYLSCFRVRQGTYTYDSPATIQDRGRVALQFYNSSPQAERTVAVIDPGSAWSLESHTFTAEWSTAIPVVSNTAALGFRTGSLLPHWFTGSVDIDDIGIYECPGNNCEALSCASLNPLSAQNLIQQPVANATFQTNAPANNWSQTSASPNPSATSDRVFPGSVSGNRFLRIRSRNWTPQAVTECGPLCWTWNQDIPLPFSDFSLYSVSTVNPDTPCPYEFNHSAEATLEECETRIDQETTNIAACPGVPPFVRFNGPTTVCQNQSASFFATVSAPNPAVDRHYVSWTETAPGTALPSPGPSTPTTSQTASLAIGDVGDTNFDITATVRSEETGQTKTVGQTIDVVPCAAEPAEDIHYSGRTLLNPPPGTESTSSQILDWKEIIGDIPL